jgi:hypothetical protein
MIHHVPFRDQHLFGRLVGYLGLLMLTGNQTNQLRTIVFCNG